jgi:hypothetical protein
LRAAAIDRVANTLRTQQVLNKYSRASAGACAGIR